MQKGEFVDRITTSESIGLVQPTWWYNKNLWLAKKIFRSKRLVTYVLGYNLNCDYGDSYLTRGSEEITVVGPHVLLGPKYTYFDPNRTVAMFDLTPDVTWCDETLDELVEQTGVNREMIQEGIQKRIRTYVDNKEFKPWTQRN